jgi:hypothetical protein
MNPTAAFLHTRLVGRFSELLSLPGVCALAGEIMKSVWDPHPAGSGCPRSSGQTVHLMLVLTITGIQEITILTIDLYNGSEIDRCGDESNGIQGSEYVRVR